MEEAGDVVNLLQLIHNMVVVVVVVQVEVNVHLLAAILMEVWFMLTMDRLIAEIMLVVVVVQELLVEQYLLVELHNLAEMV